MKNDFILIQIDLFRGREICKTLHNNELPTIYR